MLLCNNEIWRMLQLYKMILLVTFFLVLVSKLEFVSNCLKSKKDGGVGEVIFADGGKV